MRSNLIPRKIANPQFFSFLLIIGLMLTATVAANAQDPPPEAPLILKVTGVESDQGTRIALYHTIRVQVDNLDKWMGQEGHDPAKFILYIDGNAFNGLTSSPVANNTKLQFDLKRTTDSEAAWTAVLSRRPKNWDRQVPVTVRHEKAKVEGEAQATLTIINYKWFWAFVISFLAAIGLFWWLSRTSDILRVPGDQPKGKNKKGKPNRKPYSLARTQMAFWFFIIIISFVFIWMVTSNVSSLTGSVLGLMGISAATGLGAAVVDSNKRGEQEAQRLSVEEKKKSDEVEVEKLTTEIKALDASINANAAAANIEEQKAEMATKQAELAAKQKELEQGQQELDKWEAAEEPAASKSFIKDVLSDDGGISFHRFQIFAWTIVLILIFIISVYNVLAMPEFDTALLALMGISGGTYIGFKLPDKEG